MAQGKLQADGTYCHTGASCKRHGVKSTNVADSIRQQLESAKIAQSFPASNIQPENPMKWPRNFNLHYDGVDVEYDYYACEGCYVCDGSSEDADSYTSCVNIQYSNLRMANVYLNKVLRATFGFESELDIPEDLIKEASNLELDSMDSYDLEEVPDYYGPTIEVKMRPDIFKELEEYYYAKPNAVDSFNYLDYARRHGVDTTGKNPVEALKEQARINSGIELPEEVIKAEKAKLKELPFTKIQVDENMKLRPGEGKHLGSYEPARIAGIVYHQKNVGYVLLSGNDVVKDRRGPKKGTFIELF
jgi:hypothetical protein